MTQQEVVNKYIERFLADRSPESAARFRERELRRQYQSIMTWRYNMRKQGIDVETGVSTSALVENLRAMRLSLEKMHEFSGEQLDQISQELRILAATLKECRRRQREQEIESLEVRAGEIAERLDALRRQKNEPEESGEEIF